MEALGGKNGVQIHVGEQLRQLLGGHGVEDLGDVRLLLLGHAALRQGLVHGHVGLGHSCGLLLRGAAQLEEGVHIVGKHRLHALHGVELLGEAGAHGAEHQHLLCAVLHALGGGEIEQTHACLRQQLVADLHQRVQILRAVNLIQIGLDGGDARLVPGVPVQEVLIEGLDLLLRGAGRRIAGNDILDELVQLHVRGVHNLVEGAGHGAAGRDLGALQPLLVHVGVEVVLQIGALQGVDVAQQVLQLLTAHRILGPQVSLGVGRGNARVQNVFQLGLGPVGHVVKGGGVHSPAGAVALGGGQLAEGPLKHGQDLDPGDGLVLPAALEDRLPGGAVVVSGGHEHFRSLGPGELRIRSKSRRRGPDCHHADQHQRQNLTENIVFHGGYPPIHLGPRRGFQ